MSQPQPERAAPAGVTLYWRPGCPFCMMLKRSLKRRGVATIDINIWDDPAAAGIVRRAARGNETVPTVEVGGRFLVNPSVNQVMEAAGLAPAARPKRRSRPFRR